MRPYLLVLSALLLAVKRGASINQTQCGGEETIGNIRLAGPRQGTTDGAVQICNQFILSSTTISWSYLNPDDWSSEDARVACKQLGLPHSFPIPTILPSPPGVSDNRINIIEHPADCTGSETRLFDCIDNISNTSLREQDYVAGLICLNTDSCVDGSLRLIDGPTNREGRVEVCQSGHWGTVCGERWGNREAGLVCRELGFPSEGATVLELGIRRGLSYRCEPQREVLELTECSTVPGQMCNATGVRCLSYQDLPSNESTPFLPNNGNTNSSSSTIIGLGVVVGILIICLLVLTIALIGTCLKLRKGQQEVSVSVPKQDSDGLNNPVYGMEAKTQQQTPNYSSLGPTYAEPNNQEDREGHNYDAINQRETHENQQYNVLDHNERSGDNHITKTSPSPQDYEVPASDAIVQETHENQLYNVLNHNERSGDNHMTKTSPTPHDYEVPASNGIVQADN